MAIQQDLIDALVALTAQMAVQNGAMGGQPDYRRAAKDIPMFSGTPAEDVDDWIADIDRVALVEGWNENVKRRAAISKLVGIAKNWQDLTGNDLPHWEDWLERFEATFRPHLTLVEWGVKVEGRRQLPGESGAQYALEKAKLCRLCPRPLTEPEVRLEQLGGPATDFAGYTTPTSATEKELLTKILSQLPVHYGHTAPQSSRPRYSTGFVPSSPWRAPSAAVRPPIPWNNGPRNPSGAVRDGV
ncbi:hypothetical protein OUZ56_012270 [Daphnia magna]|uniref:Retrotransposon gag domain-containing protein n=1 Tax=Daphnia magna TaxID=35525 RepID=A0ABQ9Z2I1_9CRUS|nr:hypothetical protein OUZ56_012270 [Daphnia magna]